MSLKMKLTSTICAFFLILGLVITGVMAVPQATVNLGGTLTFQASDVYAKVNGEIINGENTTQLDEITINNATVDGNIDAWNSQNIAFDSSATPVKLRVQIENLATDRKLYAYVTDSVGEVFNVNKSMGLYDSISDTEASTYADTSLIELSASTGEQTSVSIIEITLSIADANTSLQSGSLYGYNIVLKDISGFKSMADYETEDGLKFTTSGKTASASGVFEEVWDSPGDPMPSYLDYKAKGAVVIPAHVKDASGNVYTVTSIASNAFSNMNVGSSATELASIHIPCTVASIGNSAFYGCMALTTVIIDNATIASEISDFSSSGRVIEFATKIYVKSDIVSSLNTYVTENWTNVEKITSGDYAGYTCYSK